MALPLIAIGVELARRFVPSLVGRLMGDKAEETAEKLITAAASVTGERDPEAALATIQQNPELALKFQQAMIDYEVTVLREDTKRLQAVNTTMRAEAKSDDPYVRRWRPTFGYVMAFSWSLLFIAVAYAIMFEPSAFSSVAEGVASLTPLFSVALAVLGINVWKRSDDKRVAAGLDPAAPIAGLMNKLKG